jgi:two-component system OmpR family response regulator
VIGKEPSVLDFVSRALRTQGFRVDRAPGVAQGVELARAGGHDVVLLDLVAAGSGDAATLRAVARAKPHRPVVVLSANTAVAFKVRCLELGAADFVAKPFELAELVARVGAQLRRTVPPPAEAERHLRAGRLTLDLLRRCVDLGDGGRPAPLSEREFGVLRHLMARAGRPCTREDLLADVWQMDFDPQTNVVDVYVHRLRDKVGRSVIRTVRNLGYVLEA